MDFIPGTVGEADNYCGTNMVPCDDLGLLSMINAVQLPSPQCSMIPPFLSSPFFGPGLLPGVEQHAKLDGHECLKELSELNIDLHAQAAAIKAKTGTATLAAYICPEPLINIKPSSVVEMSLAAINKFYVTITNVEKLSRQNLHFDRAYDSSQQRDDNLFGGNLGSLNSIPLLEDDMEIAGNTTGTEDVPRKTQIRVDTPLALLMVSCYIQLINVFSDMFFVAQKTLRELKNEPIPSIGEHIMQMGMFYGMEGRLQGLIFCTIVTHYLDRVERILGLLPSSTKQSLPLKHGLLKEPHFKELLDKEMERYGVSGRSSPRVLRDTIENMRRVMAADASW
ncbi:hypothetical protein BX600DRAFT_507189 [Xylariales sp. PMI_506]|nr:hypothetical protein BX600DRAFT_507189 [Xylariales sp. PMI_506]